MTPYVTAQVHHVDLDSFGIVCRLVSGLRDPDPGVDGVLSCHVLADALARVVPGLDVQRGYYTASRIYEHSWLVTHRGSIIDPYPVGTLGGPILVDGSGPLSPACRLYFPDNRFGARLDVPGCLVAKVERELRAAFPPPPPPDSARRT